MPMDYSKAQIFCLPDGRLSARGAAQYIGLSEKTLAQWRCNGTGPRFIKRGRIFYFKADLDDYISVGAATSTAQARRVNNDPA
jgi:hypothetical protein